MNAFPRWPALAAYGTMRVPLALLELPLYVVVPALYAGTFGVDLSTVGAVLFAVRLLDAIADPWIGATIDAHRARADHRRWIGFGLPALAAGFAAMLLPPVEGALLPAWLGLSSVVTFLAYSVVSIAHQAWGSGFGDTAGQRARVTAIREGLGLVGVLGACALLAPRHAAALAWTFAALSAIAWIALRAAPPPRAGAGTSMPIDRRSRYAVLRVAPFRWLLAAFTLNALANAMPATLLLFFVRDVLGAGDDAAGEFLLAYFVAGAVGMPLWARAADRLGARNAWLLGIAVAVLGFAWALGVGPGDRWAFLAVCAVSGLALGCDLALPGALLATVIADAGDAGRREGAFFGVWNLSTKLSLAAAGGIALPLLAALGYVPGQGGAPLSLYIAYAALPCALKLVAGLVLLLAPPTESRADLLATGGTR